jgi:chitinase
MTTPRRARVRSTLFLLLALLAALPAAAQQPRIVAYYPEWAGAARKYHPADIPADQLTHVNYAFATVDAAGRCALVDRKAALERPYPNDPRNPGVLRQLQLLKQKHPHLRTLISVGGWTLSGNFSDAAATERARDLFALSCLDLVTRYGFDGVDIDWEYPGGGGREGNKSRPQDSQNFTLLLAELRRQLDNRARVDGHPYLLTIAAPAGRWAAARFDLARIHPAVDWINLMAYDFANASTELTAFHAPLYASTDDPRKDAKKLSADAAVKTYLAAGVPAHKIVLGVPFYGRGWTGAAPASHGLFQKHARPAANDKSRDTWTYKEITTLYGTQYWHPDAQAPWLYDDRTGTMVTFDNPRSLAAKADYILKQHLGGAMIWEISGDDGTLLPALRAALQRP